MEAIIHFIIKYNDKIIYISAGLISLLSVIVVWWQVFGKRGLNTEDKPEIDLGPIEETLKKILSQTNNAIQTVAAAPEAATAAATATPGAAAPAAGAVAKIEGVTTLEGRPITDVAGVKNELQIRARIIEDLQTQVKNAKNDGGSAELLAKIKDLEGKLSEYEIIEDDIADLSFFKEENAKLKKELEAIKRADPKMVDQFAAVLESTGASSSASIPEPKVSAEDIMKAAQTQAAATAIPTEAPTTLEELADVPAPDEIVAANDVDKAVMEAQKELSSDLGQKAPAINAVAAEDASAEAKGDIFGEFSKSEGDPGDPLAELGDIDPDRMLDELKDLNADMNIGAEALEEDPDMDKMADEATNLPKKG